MPKPPVPLRTVICADCGKTRRVKSWRHPERCRACMNKQLSKRFNPKGKLRP